MLGNYDLKPEHQLLLSCSLTQISDENIKKIQQLINRDLDWDYLINMAYKHRLSPLLYWHLNRISPESIPSNLKLELKKHFHKNVQKNLMMFKELLDVLDILQKQDVVPIPYKGPVLAILIYKNLGFRIFGDLDFYVPLEDVPKTREILVNEGYEPWEKLTSAQEKSFYKFQREYHFINKLTCINLEIKWKFLSTLIPTNESVFQENEFFKEVNLDQFKVKTISPEYLILILSIHNASHAFSSLYRFCDISELIKYCNKNVKWEYLMEIADVWGVKRIFLINLKISRELFQIQLPEDVLELINNSNVDEISKDIVKRLFTSKPRGVLGKVVFHSNLREKRKDKLKTILIMIFLPTPGVIESVSLPKTLEPLYYILRVFQMVKNVITNQ